MKLLVLTVNKNDSTSFYRANGVLQDLKNQMDLEITSMDFKDLRDMSWATLFLYDLVFMQRPYQGVAVKMAQYCREINLPVWVDFDDQLLNIPKDNKSHQLFTNPEIQKYIVRNIQLANVVTVSTQKLKESFNELNNNIHVIPNAFNDKLFSYRNLNGKLKTNKTVLWRGSDTHNLDLFYYADQIYSSQQKYTDWDFMYFGFNPWFIPESKNHKHINATDPILYFKQIHKLAPRVMNVPLIRSLFNECKSNIAYIEGTFAGAVCLVPDWDEWKLPGAINYSNINEYGEKLELMLNEKVNFNKYNSLAWEYIMDNLRLEHVNKKRVELLNSLL
jgi:hypothetical protein